MGDAPGGWKPGKTGLFTPQFTAIFLFSGCETRCGVVDQCQTLADLMGLVSVTPEFPRSISREVVLRLAYQPLLSRRRCAPSSRAWSWGRPINTLAFISAPPSIRAVMAAEFGLATEPGVDSDANKSLKKWDITNRDGSSELIRTLLGPFYVGCRT